MPRRPGPPSPGWAAFLRNHTADIAAIDLFVVPTIGFQLLYGLVILRLERRRLVWTNVTANPTADWVARQITEAFPWDAAPRYLLEKGAGIWSWASNDENAEPDIVMASCGDVPTMESLAATTLLRQQLPDVKIRFVNVVDLAKLVPNTEHTHGPTDREFEALFTADKPVVFNFHGYPWLIHRLTYRRPGLRQYRDSVRVSNTDRSRARSFAWSSRYIGPTS